LKATGFGDQNDDVLDSERLQRGTLTAGFRSMNSGLWSDEKRGLYTTSRSRGPLYSVGKGIIPGSILPERCREQNGRRVQKNAVSTGMRLKA